MTKAKFEHKSDARWTKDQLDKDTRINEHQLGFILWIEQFYMLHSELPNYETTCNHITITEEQWREYWLYPPVREALLARGIRLRLPDGANGDTVTDDSVPLVPYLNGRQLALINDLLDFNNSKPDHKKCSDLGITFKEFQAWQADPVFNNYFQQRAAKLLSIGASDADRALLDNVRMGDQRAIQYFNEMTGRYRPQDPQIVNFTLMVNQIIDILGANLNPEQAERIGSLVIAAVESAGIQIQHPGQRPTPVGHNSPKQIEEWF